MTDKEGSSLVIKGLRVVNHVMKMAMFPHVLEHADKLACDRHGCMAFNGCVTELDDPFIRSYLLYAVVINVVALNYHRYGNLVVQHVLGLCDLRCTRDVAVNLRGHCVELSFMRYGSYIVEKLLDVKEAMVVVVEEVLECEGERLVRFAKDRYGNYVVYKALRVTQARRDYLFWVLVNKLRPLVHLLGESYTIVSFLNSIR